MPEALAQLPPQVWQQRWVVHSAATGTRSGRSALPEPLRVQNRHRQPPAPTPAQRAGCAGPSATAAPAPGAISTSNPSSSSAASSSTSCRPASIACAASAGCIRRQRVRLNRVRALLKTPPRLSAAEQAAWQPPAPGQPSAPLDRTSCRAPPPAPLPCPRCGRALVLVGQWRPGQDWRGLLSTAPSGVQRTTRPP